MNHPFIKPIVEIIKLNESEPDDNKIQKELSKFAEEVTYHALVTYYFRVNPTLVEKLVNEPDFPIIALQFRKAHTAAFNAPDEVVANAILAGKFLLEKEGYNSDTADLSPSQCFIPNAVEYHKNLDIFLSENGNGIVPPPLTGDWSTDYKNIRDEIEKYSKLNAFKDVPDQSQNNDNSNIRMEDIEKLTIKAADQKIQIKLLNNFYEDTLPKVLGELYRHPIENEVLTRMKGLLKDSFIIDPKRRTHLSTTVISNLVMAKVKTDEGPKFTATRWIKSDGVLGKDNFEEIPDLECTDKTVTTEDIIRHTRNIFNGQPGVDKLEKFETQTEKIYNAAPDILQFLACDYSIPPNLRQKILQTLNIEMLGKQIAKRFCSLTDNDVNSVNRFHRKGGLTEAQKFEALRFVCEFLEGVNTHLILKTGSLNDKMDRIVGWGWNNDNHSGVSDEIISDAINQTLIDGENQIRLYNQDPTLSKKERKRIMRLPANVRMQIENAAFEVDGAKVMRWKNQMDANDLITQKDKRCICLQRCTFFNPWCVITR